ncbi:MAG TPA: amidohydrolase family protein [Acidobacteriota bacterium]|nr:amidohydrolase family protein [Acidobacteriota bacterium]HRV07155.1 amidohydrolase family protein [Acidobacteriota bacterium]
MNGVTRREWMAGFAGATLAGPPASLRGGSATARETEGSPTACPLALVDFQPRSMLQVKETHVPRSRYPVIDVHTHLTFVEGSGKDIRARHLITPEEAIELMDRKNIAAMVNLTGGYGPGFDDTLDYWTKAHDDRFLVCCEPWFDRILEDGYSRILADEVERCAGLGAKGLKVLKTLGLYLRERLTEGPLVKVDDPRFDEMWEAAGSNHLPVMIHTSDPLAFFLPIDRFNERFEELNAHPDWSFYDRDYPSDRELQEARVRVMQRHPRTTFVALHVAVAEDLEYVSRCMRECPNMYVEIGARVGELGRQPRAARRFFEEFQDRIMFGTDAIPLPDGAETPQQVFVDELYEIYYRFLETDDEYFDYAPAPVPPQGRWRIYGLNLPDEILRKVYHNNAARLFGLT